mgnify:FL=1
MTDRLLAEAAVHSGSLSGAARDAINFAYGEPDQAAMTSKSMDRARAYMEAKKFGMYFSRDVGLALNERFKDIEIQSDVIWDTNATVFKANYWLPSIATAVICQPAEDEHLMMALAEALIGLSKAPIQEVWVVFPYRLPGCLSAQAAYDIIPNVRLVEFSTLCSEGNRDPGPPVRPEASEEFLP